MKETIKKLKKDHIDFVTGKPKVHRFDLRLPHELWKKLMIKKAETGDDVTKIILSILDQSLD